MKAIATLLVGCMVWGTALPVSQAVAGPHALVSHWEFGVLAAGQAEGGLDLLTDDTKAKAKLALQRGRAALGQGDLPGAIAWYQRAATVQARFAPNEYTPEHLAAELVRAGVDARHLAVRTEAPASPFVLRPSDLDRMPSDRLPLLPPGSPPGQSPSFSGGTGRGADPPTRLPTPSPADSTGRDEMLRLLAQARTALARGDVPTAQRLAERAEGLGVPDRALSQDDPRPWQVLLEIHKVQQRQGGPVAPAAHSETRTAVGTEEDDRGEFPVRQGVYQPGSDPTRNQLAQLQLPAPQTQNSAAPPPSEGQRLYQQGIEALENQDRQKALERFRQAWRHEAELDPVTRRQLKDKLGLLQPPLGRPGAAKPSEPVEEIRAEQQVLREKLYREVNSEQAAADKQAQRDPKAALERLQKLRGRITQSELDPSGRKQLLTMVDRSIGELEQFIAANRPNIELDERNRAIRDSVNVDRQRTVEVQNKIAEMVEQFNKLLEEGRYAEAEVIAKQARELEPDSAVVQNLIWKSRFARRLAEQASIDERKEQGFYDAMTSVHASSAPFDDRRPLQFIDQKDWKDLTLSRRAMMERHRNRQRMSPAEQEIERSLKYPVEVRFSDQPLADVMETLSRLSGAPIYLDPQGLAAEGVTSDTPVTIRLTQQISLQSALNLILEPLRLSYVIQNEVLRVTSEQTRETNVVTHVYNVADLVIPIPNFVPGYNVGLPAALEQAHRALGHGASANRPAGMMPLGLAGQGAAEDGAPNASVLAQMGAGSTQASPSGRGRGRGAGMSGYGPGGAGGAEMADFDTLIELITTTIDPESWLEAGGPGTIDDFPTNLSLVISQTQEIHDKIADLLEQLRRLADLQVTIEVRFITLNDNFFERIGIDFDFDIDDNVINLPPDDEGPSVIVGLDPSGVPTADLDLSFTQGGFESAVPAFGGFDAATAANFGFAILSDIEVFFLLQAAQGDSRTNILQAPKVTLFNGQQASVSDTSQRPFVTSMIPVVGDFAAAHQPVIVVLSEGTSLSVQAVVSADRRFVRLTLVPFFSQIGEVEEFTFHGRTTSDSGSTVVDADGSPRGVNNARRTTEGTTVQLPTFAFTTVTTTVSVPDGGTVLLGGIKRLREGRNEVGVPLLSKLPWINRLFKNVGIGRETQSLMMMVTPRIIIQEEEEERLGIELEP